MKELLSEIVGYAIPAIITLILGFLADNPKYKMAKKKLKQASDALDDNKITHAEYKQIIDFESKKVKKDKKVQKEIELKIKK